jgi:hypothetical protein
VNLAEVMDRFAYTPGRRYSMHAGPASHFESPS